MEGACQAYPLRLIRCWAALLCAAAGEKIKNSVADLKEIWLGLSYNALRTQACFTF